MSAINVAVVSGRLTRDPEIRHTPNGATVVRVGLAQNERRPDGNGGYVEKTHFFEITVWGKFGELVARKLAKGSAVTVKGRLEHRQWEQDGAKRSAISIVAEDIEGQDFYKPADQDNAVATPAGAQDELKVDADDDIPF